MDVRNCEGLEYLRSIQDESVDLVLTDPPYITSRNSGMDALWNQVHSAQGPAKTEEDWEKYRALKKLEDDPKKRENYIQYGTVYGKEFALKTQYGDWDANFTMDTLDTFVKLLYKKLKPGGTIIIWFDLWKITPLKEMLERHKFKQIRFIEWIKNNPAPINSGINYLSNAREMALTAVKKSKPTFNSKYDNGVYHYPLCAGKGRFHPTQKNEALFIDLIKKHTHEGAVVLDPFLGSGTTLRACQKTGRVCKGCEVNKEYFDQMNALLK